MSLKSDKANVLQIKELLSEISELDNLIALHQSENDNLMLKQYNARKRKFFDELVKLILSSYPVSEMPPAFYIGKLMQRFYPQALEKPAESNPIESVLQPLFA